MLAPSTSFAIQPAPLEEQRISFGSHEDFARPVCVPLSAIEARAQVQGYRPHHGPCEKQWATAAPQKFKGGEA